MRIYSIILMAILLSLTSISAIADFKLITISQDDNGSFSVSLETKNIKKSGKNLKKAWITHNYGETQITKTDVKSTKILYEVDCKNDLYRVLQMVNYSGANGAGASLSNYSFKEDFIDVNPNSMSEMIHQSICN